MILYSIIVPVYNAQAYLNSCINSILSQSYKNLEIILVNDGSNDGSENILEAFRLKDNRIIVLNKENGGLPSARNAGLKIANGDYVGFVDSDDMLLKDTIFYVNQDILTYHPDIIQFQTIRFTQENDLVPINEKFSSKTVKFFDGVQCLFSFYGDGEITTTVCNKIYKQDIIKNKMFDSNARYFAEDVLFLGQLFWETEKVLVTNHQAYLYRVTPNSLVTIGLNNNKYDSSMYAYKQNKAFYKEKNKEVFNLADKFLSSAFLNWRIRRKEIIYADRKVIFSKLIGDIKENLPDFIVNPLIKKKIKVLLVLSCVTLRFVDMYGWLSARKRY